MSAMLPDNTSGMGTPRGAAPQIVFTTWFRNRITPKVARIWERWSRSYNQRKIRNSSARPKASAAGSVSTSAPKNPPVHDANTAAR
jgi:hypothetical protein